MSVNKRMPNGVLKKIAGLGTYVIDSVLDRNSTNAVQNRAIANAMDEKQSKIFKGTTAEWTALSTTEKRKYEFVVLTDD